MNSGIASQEAVQGRKGPHPGPGCPVAAVGTVIHVLKCVSSLHDSQLAGQGAAQVLWQREIRLVVRAFGHLKPLLSL